VALDPEHRLSVSAVVGRHAAEHVGLLVEDFHRRTAGRLMNLLTSDANPASAAAILASSGAAYQPRRQGKRGPRPAPRQRPPKGLPYATVPKTREKNRVVGVEQRVLDGTVTAVVAALAASLVSTTVNTVFVERANGTDRHRKARKVRKTDCFAKDWEVQEAVSYFTLYSDKCCWPVRTLRQGNRRQGYRQRTPALAAGLTDHLWTLKEWLSRPAVQRK
jgi:hypothetical protein